VTLTAVTAPLSIRVEAKNSLTELLRSDRIVVGFFMFSILIMIGVSVWSTAILLPIRLSPGHPGFSSIYYCHITLEYCSSSAGRLLHGHLALGSE
jgi:hypothetical protein